MDHKIISECSAAASISSFNILRVSTLRAEKTPKAFGVAEVELPQPGGAGCGTLLLRLYSRWSQAFNKQR
jgi:hypothetical protein